MHRNWIYFAKIQFNVEKSIISIVINVIMPKNITVSNNDLIINKNLDLYTAILGGSLSIEFLDKNIKIKIPKYTQNNKSFRIKGKGYPNKLNTLVGDLYIKINIVLPKNLTDTEIKLFEKLKNLNNEETRQDTD
jgi:curved DNA-binding protein